MNCVTTRPEKNLAGFRKKTAGSIIGGFVPIAALWKPPSSHGHQHQLD
jgi:hypothetical protein